MMNIDDQKDTLIKQAEKYDFFHAVRVIERQFKTQENKLSNKVGHDSHPAQEAIQFKVNQSVSFPGRTIHKINEIHNSDNEFTVEMLVSFFGLTGTKGVLPHHYTEMILQQERKKDKTLANFLDIFNHRLLSLFYRAWEKYKLPIQLENYIRSGDTTDGFSQCLGNLTNSLSTGLDTTKVFYGGHFAKQVRSASNLKHILSDFLEMDVEIHQFEGQWLFLQSSDQSRLAFSSSKKGQYNQLGRNLALGKRIWDTQSKFTMELKPDSLEKFNSLLPGGDIDETLCNLTRQYVGNGMNFDIKMSLPSIEVPACQLIKSNKYTPKLGWNTWTKKRKDKNVLRQAVFHKSAHG